MPGLLLVLSLTMLPLLACRSEAGTSGDLGLVWEAWGLIKGSYVEGDAVDSQRAVGEMIVGMLEAGNLHPYPTLTELDSVQGRPPVDAPAELVDVWRAWTLIGQRSPGLDSKLLAEAAIDGLLSSLGDDTVERLTPEAYDRVQEDLRGNYQGIGALVAIEEGSILLSPMTDSPAERADLQPGDELLEVDGEPVEGKTLQEVTDQVRGPSGSVVKLLVERSGEEEPVEVSVSRGVILQNTVNRSLFPGAIGYIYISDFSDSTYEDVLDALEELKQVDMLGLVLDLRGNPGGSVEAAQKVASQFLSDGLLMYEIDKDGQRKDWFIEEGGIYTDGQSLPVVVLVNELTGGESEAVAGALQDAKRAQVLGNRTLGKGSANVYEELSDGSAISIAVSHWHTPSGRLIQSNGIEPDIDVDLTQEDLLFGVDPQLTQAYQYLDQLLPEFR